MKAVFILYIILIVLNDCFAPKLRLDVFAPQQTQDLTCTSRSPDDARVINMMVKRAIAEGRPFLLGRMYCIKSDLNIPIDLKASGGALFVSAGSTVTINGDIDAPVTAQIFNGRGKVVASSASFVSVAWWGAISSANIDAAPAFRAAWGSHRRILVPAGKYLLCSTERISSHDAQATDPEAILYADASNVDLDFTGATLVVCPNIAREAVGTLAYVHVSHIHHRGGTFVGTKVGIPIDAENNAIGVINVADFDLEDVVCKAGYEGIGSCLGGDWVVDSSFKNIKAFHVGIFADFAFLKRVSFENVIALGQGEARNTQGDPLPEKQNPGQKGFSLIYDLPNSTFNKTGVAFWESEDIRISSSRFSNFVTGVALGTGSNIRLVRNQIEDNPGTKELAGVGIYIFGSADGFYPHNIVIEGGNLSNNGDAKPGAGLTVSCPPAPPIGLEERRIENIVLRQLDIIGNIGPALDAMPSCARIGLIRLDRVNMILGRQGSKGISDSFLQYVKR